MRYIDMRLGKVQKRLLLVLLGGVALGFSRTPRKYYRVLGVIASEWKRIGQSNFTKTIDGLSQQKLVQRKRMADGSYRLTLTNEGKKVAVKLKIKDSGLKLKKPSQWDKKWRLVIYDIPEKDKIFRNILREHLYELEFYKLQNSVFVSPYPYEDLILELIKIYSAEKYVRVITALKVDNEKKIRSFFFKN